MKTFVCLILKAHCIHGRTDLEEFKQKFANAKEDMTLDKAMKDADVFIGLSVGNVVTPDMVKSMAKNPIVFAMANPDPEIHGRCHCCPERYYYGNRPQ